METRDLAIVGAAYLFAALVKGTTGLGFSTSALAVLAMTIGIKAALPLLIVPSLVSNAVVMIRAGHFFETLRRFWPMFALTVPGVGLGLLVLTRADPSVAGAVLGAVMALYALFVLAAPEVRMPARLERPLGPLVGILTGAINGVTGSQVMPVLPFLLALRLDADRFVQAINVSFSLCSLTMAIGLSGIGLMTKEAALVSTAGLVPVFVGIHFGTRLRTRLTPETFRRVVLVFLLVSGLFLIARAFW